MATQTIKVYEADQAGPVMMDPKDPESVLLYTFDWTEWLDTGDTLSTHTITAQTGITVDSDAIAANTKVNITLSGGTANKDYIVECLITTANGLTDERSMRIPVRER